MANDNINKTTAHSGDGRTDAASSAQCQDSRLQLHPKEAVTALKEASLRKTDIFSQNPDLIKGTGEIQIGNDCYKVIGTHLEKVVARFGQETLESQVCGQLQANGTVKFFENAGGKTIDLRKADALIRVQYQDKTYNVLCSGGKQYNLDEIENDCKADLYNLNKSAVSRAESKCDLFHALAGKYLDYVSQQLGYETDDHTINDKLKTWSKPATDMIKAIEQIKTGRTSAGGLASSAYKISSLSDNYQKLSKPLHMLIDNSSNRINSVANVESQVPQWAAMLASGEIIGPLLAASINFIGNLNKYGNAATDGKQAFSEAAGMIVAAKLLGPGVYEVGEKAAGEIFAKVAGDFKDALKPEAVHVMQEQLSKIKLSTVGLKSNELLDQMIKLTKQVTTSGAADEKLAQALVKELQPIAGNTAKHEVKQLFKNAGGGVIASVTTDVAMTLTGLQSPAQLFKNLASHAVKNAEGAMVLHVGFRTAGAVAGAATETATKAGADMKQILLAQDAHGDYYAGQGMVIEREGKQFTVGPEPQRMQPNDKLVLSNESPTPKSATASDALHAVTGEGGSAQTSLRNHKNSKDTASKRSDTKILSDEEADKFTFTHVRAQENTPHSPDGLRKSMGRLGNFRFERRTVDKYDEDNKTAVSLDELQRIYCLPGHETEIVVSNHHAKQLAGARNYYLKTQFGLQSGYKAADYSLINLRAGELAKPPLTKKDWKTFAEGGWRLFPEDNHMQTAVLIPASERARITADLTSSPNKQMMSRLRQKFDLKIEQDKNISFMHFARPEHLAAELVGLPIPGLVYEMRLADNYDPHTSPGQDPHDIAAETDTRNMRITYFNPENGFGFDDLTSDSQHEFTHALDFHDTNGNIGRYHLAVELENGLTDPKANLREYGQTDLYENFAVLGEGLLSPDGREFARAVNNERSYIRTTIFAQRLRRYLDSSKSALGVHRDEYVRRVNYIEDNIRPLAIQKLNDLRKQAIAKGSKGMDTFFLIQDLEKPVEKLK